jgi:dUTP pyrophosphatase|tara:strand:+ start:180 stop:638 length:459 start_codon:yes stop_codon:yes gene_type:complete
MSHPLHINVEIMENAMGLPIPSYQTDRAAGMDLFAAIDKPIELSPLERIIVPTGLKLSLPSNMEAQIRPRSGLAFKQGITVLNSPGTIDSDYRGEIKILLINLGQNIFKIEHGDRVAQLVIAPITQANLHVVLKLDATQRGHGGFGSTDQKV